MGEYIEGGHDNFKLRNEKGMRNAILEWYILGEANYCLSPTDELSTFSKTAIARSFCKYIDFKEGRHCDVSKVTKDSDDDIEKYWEKQNSLHRHEISSRR